MIRAAFVLDAETGETIARFGMEHGPDEYRPERWCLARRYTIPAVGPGGHSWRSWCGAIVILGSVAGVVGRAL